MPDEHSVERSVENQIEWVRVTPQQRNAAPPILFLHGMWHGAWCWEDWQHKFADLGWDSVAISLPGHGASPIERSTRFATMQTYLDTLREVIFRFDTPPIIIGHSMGGALIQWYLAKVADDLPAAVLLASWTARSTWADGMLRHLKRDPWGTFKVGLTLSTDPFIRSPKWSASMLITESSTWKAPALHACLCSESALVLNQHNPPLWRPKADPETPLLWLAADEDAVVSRKGAEKSAAFYGAAFEVIEDSGHNIMMAHDNARVVAKIDQWLNGAVRGT